MIKFINFYLTKTQFVLDLLLLMSPIVIIADISTIIYLICNTGLFVSTMFFLGGYNLNSNYALFQQAGLICISLITSIALTKVACLYCGITVIEFKNLIPLGIIYYIILLIFRKLVIILRTKGVIKRKIFILHGGWLTNKILEELKDKPELGLYLEGIATNLSEIQHLPKETIIIDARDNNIALMKSRVKNAFINLNDGSMRPISLLDGQHFFESISRRIPTPENFNEVNINIIKQDLTMYDHISAIINIIFATLGLIITFPICLLISILIKLEDGGPIFFLQKRIGFLGKPFVIYKFRTMKTKSRSKKITQLGKILRKIRLDELPQFINILRRDINIIGPRPFMLSENRVFNAQVPLFSMRYAVKPGITGLAQILHRYENTLKDVRVKLGYDLYYIKHRGITLDLMILIQSLFTICLGKGK